MSTAEKVALTDAQWCTPMWGSCALLSGHNGPHHGYPENIAAIVAEAVDRERERIAETIEGLPTYYVQGEGGGWLHAVRTHDAVRIARALLAADDTEGKP